MSTVLFECQLPSQCNYQLLNSVFHTFETQHLQLGILFSSEKHSRRFFKHASHCLSQIVKHYPAISSSYEQSKESMKVSILFTAKSQEVKVKRRSGIFSIFKSKDSAPSREPSSAEHLQAPIPLPPFHSNPPPLPRIRQTDSEVPPTLQTDSREPPTRQTDSKVPPTRQTDSEVPPTRQTDSEVPPTRQTDSRAPPTRQTDCKAPHKAVPPPPVMPPKPRAPPPLKLPAVVRKPPPPPPPFTQFSKETSIPPPIPAPAPLPQKLPTSQNIPPNVESDHQQNASGSSNDKKETPK